MATFSLYSNVTDRYTYLASSFARGSVANASACLAGFSKRAALSCQSFDNASLAGVWIWWTGTMEWNGGMDRTGMVEWNGMEQWNDRAHAY